MLKIRPILSPFCQCNSDANKTWQIEIVIFLRGCQILAVLGIKTSNDNIEIIRDVFNMYSQPVQCELRAGRQAHIDTIEVTQRQTDRQRQREKLTGQNVDTQTICQMDR